MMEIYGPYLGGVTVTSITWLGEDMDGHYSITTMNTNFKGIHNFINAESDEFSFLSRFGCKTTS